MIEIKGLFKEGIHALVCQASSKLMIQFVVVAIIHAVNAREMKQLIVLLVAQMITGPLCKF